MALERLPAAVEAQAARIMITWNKATTVRPTAFGPLDEFPAGIDGWVLGVTDWVLFVADEPMVKPQSFRAHVDHFEIDHDTYRQATYALPDSYWREHEPEDA